MSTERAQILSHTLALSSLQSVLLLLGTDESEIGNWGKIRMLTNYKMIKRLSELKEKDVTAKVGRMRSDAGCAVSP